MEPTSPTTSPIVTLWPTLTLISETRAPDADYDALRMFFSDEDISKMSVAIGLINVWNRLAVGFRSRHPIDQPVVAAA